MAIFTAKTFVATVYTFEDQKRNLKDVRTKVRTSFLSIRFNSWLQTTCRFGHPVRRKRYQRQRRHQQWPYPMRSVPAAEKSLLRDGLEVAPGSDESPE